MSKPMVKKTPVVRRTFLVWCTKQLKLLRGLNPDWILVAAIVAIAMVPLYLNMLKPLWFDEVWRAHIISSWQLNKYDSSAPLPLLFMVLVKLVTFVFNNEFTQRVVYSTISLGLIPLMYLFGREIRSRKFGLLLAASLPLTFYYLDYIIENKVFLTDIFLTIVFLWLFKKYLQRRLSLAWFIGFGIIYMLGSTSSLYLFIAAGLWQLIMILRRQENWRRLLGWATPLAVMYLVYYFVFLHPQVMPDLLKFWEIDQWRGKSPGYVMKYVSKHVLSTFGFNVTQLWPAITINFPILQSGFITFAAINPFFLQFEWLFGMFVLSWFVTGVVSLVRRGYGYIPFSIAVIWVVSFILAYFRIAPFGNNRANLFLFGLMALTAWLGLYELVSWLWHRNSMWAQGALIGVIMACAWFVPVNGLNTRLVTPRPVYYLDGMPTAAAIIRKESGPKDLVVNFHFMNQQSFLYYYNFNTKVKKLNARPSENLVFDTRLTPITDSTQYYRELSKKYQTVWVVWGAGIGHDVTDNAHEYFKIDLRSTYGFVGLAKLTRLN